MKQVFLSSTATEYSSRTIELNKPIKNDLVLDQTQENLYVMTTDKVKCPACIKGQVCFHFLCNFTWDLCISQLFLEVSPLGVARPDFCVWRPFSDLSWWAWLLWVGALLYPWCLWLEMGSEFNSKALFMGSVRRIKLRCLAPACNGVRQP